MKLCMDLKQALMTMVRSVNELHIEGELDATVQVSSSTVCFTTRYLARLFVLRLMHLVVVERRGAAI